MLRQMDAMGKGAENDKSSLGGDGAFDLRWGFQKVGRGQVTQGLGNPHCLGENLSPRASSQRTASSGRLHTGPTAAGLPAHSALALANTLGCVPPIPSTWSHPLLPCPLVSLEKVGLACLSLSLA